MHCSNRSLDHLVGDAEQPGREGKAERLGGLHIDHQLELGRLLDRQLTHLGASEDAVNVACRLAELFGEIVTIGDQNYSSSGAGGSNHLACVLLNSTIGIEVTHVPFRNVVQGLQEVMAGRIDYDCVSLPLALPQIAGKTVKPIAILSKARSSSLPDLPSAHEQGLTNFDLPSWYALFLPAKTPQPIVQRLNSATVAAMEMAILQGSILSSACEATNRHDGFSARLLRK
jgi:Tripartite tricarboxylate transporter family receptor